MSVLKSCQSTFDAPEGENFQFMKNMCLKGMKVKGFENSEWHRIQLEKELDIIKELKLEDFEEATYIIKNFNQIIDDFETVFN